VEPTTALFERNEKRVEIAPAGEIWRHQCGLRSPHPFDQHLQIMHPAEEVLFAPECAQLLAR
jgi:hypothetical protein